MCEVADNFYAALQSKTLTDCEFSFEDEAEGLVAHKNLLSISSPVFDRMFFGALPTTGSVRILDVRKPVFVKLLAFIYGQKVFTFEDVKEACEFYYAAQKYDIPKGIKVARNFLLGNENHDNLGEIQAIGDLFDDPELKKKSLKLVNSAFLEEIHKKGNENDGESIAMSMALERFKIEVEEEPLLVKKLKKVVSMIRHLIKDIKNIAFLVVDDDVDVEFKSFIMRLPKELSFAMLTDYWARDYVERTQLCEKCESDDDEDIIGGGQTYCLICNNRLAQTKGGNIRKVIWNLTLKDVENLRNKYELQKGIKRKYSCRF